MNGSALDYRLPNPGLILLALKKTEFIMSETKKVCELCGLPVQTRGFKLKTKDGEKLFCCEGCKSIYRLLYQDSAPPKLK